MARARSPNRDKAKQIWLESGGKKLLKDIAADLGIGETQVRKWKSIDKWEDELKGNVTNESEITKGNVTKRKGAPLGNKNAVGNRGGGAPKGNQNAKGNRGGLGGPLRNDKAVKHGLFRRFLPDDEETREIYDAVGQANPLDLLWEQIQIKFTAIIRAQKIMFVKDQDDKTIERIEEKGGNVWGERWEVQQAWDKHATFLNAQTRAMSTLASLIKQYEEMCKGQDDEERLLRIEKMKAEIDQIKGGNKSTEAEDWTAAVEAIAKRRQMKVSSDE